MVRAFVQHLLLLQVDLGLSHTPQLSLHLLTLADAISNVGLRWHFRSTS
jgi:hypothetical protein